MSGVAVEYHPVARAEIREADEWWMAHRPEKPDAVRDAVMRGVALLGEHPEIGPRARNVRLPGLRRLPLHGVPYALYYRVEVDQIVILSLWDTRQGAGPRL